MTRNQILIDGHRAFDSWETTDNLVTLISPVLKEALNKHAALTCSIPLTHPLAAAVTPLITTVTAIRDGKDAFHGRVRKITRNIWGTADIVCEGPTAYLSDTIQPPWTWSGPISGLLNYFLNRHNATTTGPTWILGTVTAVDPNQSITRWSTEWLTTWEVLTSRFPESALGGYLLARRGTGNTMVLDYVDTPGPLSGQLLNISENIIDINQILDATMVATRLIPLGALLEQDEDIQTGNGPLPASRVGIESVNSGIAWIEDADLVNTLGAITATHIWDDITQPTTLLTRGYEELVRRKVAALSIDVDALDLSTLNVNTDALSLGSTVHIIATHLGINQQAIIQEIETPLAEPGLKVHIGAETTSFIKQTLDAQKASADKIIAVQSSNAKINEAVTEVRTDVENARVAAEIAQSDAATAQAKADSATTDAAAAQSSANSAQTAAADAQSSADAAAQAATDVGAQAAAELAQTTLELQSQINQSAAQISAEINQIYTSKTSTTEQIAALKSYLELSAAGLYLTLSQMNAIRSAIDSDIDSVADSITTLQTLIWADTAGIHIGRSSDPVTMLLTNGSLNFYLNGNRIAWFDGAAQQLKIDNARITTSLVIGDGMWVPESSSPLGGMSLVEAI